MVVEQPQPEEPKLIIEQSTDASPPNEQKRWNFNVAFGQAMEDLSFDVIYNANLPLRIRQLAINSTHSFLEEIRETQHPEVYGSDVWQAIALVPQAVRDTVMTHQQNYRTAAREPEGVHVMQYSPDHGLEPGSTAETQRTYTVDMQRIVWQFLREHPEFPVCGQILLDWVHTIQASDQSTHPLYKDYEALKKQFYELYANMNEDVPTTDSSMDIARAASIIRVSRASGKPMDRLAIAGSGNMARFEGPLLILLAGEGINFEQIIAVDIEDYSAVIRDTLPDLPIEFHKGNILDTKSFGGNKVNMLFYPWSVFSDILPRRDSIRALHTAASLMEPGGILTIDQAIPIGPSSYILMQEKQAPITGELGVFQRSFAGPEGQKLWSTFNIMSMETLLRDAAQVGFVPLNIGSTVVEQHAVVAAIEANETVLQRQAASGESLDAMKHPIYQANGWNRMTLALEYVGQEEALRRAKAAPSLFHTLSLAMGEAEDGS